jgi:hypothetical protein
VPDPGPVEVTQGVEQRLGAEVQRMVVRERHAPDDEIDKRLHGAGWSPEEERLVRIGPRVASIRDAALEVEDEQIGLAADGRDGRRDQRLGRLGREPFADHAAEHRVTGERDPHLLDVTDPLVPCVGQSERRGDETRGDPHSVPWRST